MARRRWISRRFFPEPPVAGPLGYVRRPDRLSAGNAVEVLAGGAEAFPAMLAAIAAAGTRILFSTYILRDDRTGKRFQEALLERSRAGVRIFFAHDALGSLGAVGEGYLEPLRAAGIQVLEFFPIAPWRRNWGFNRRNHQKILVVDGQIGFTGGINLGDEYAPAPEGGGWMDLHARVEGPAAGELERVFARSWRLCGGSGLTELERARPTTPAAAAGKGALVETIDNVGLRNRWRMHKAYRQAVRAARSSILIANSYFLPDVLLRRSFRDAVRRGVSVRVLLPSVSDVAIVQYASKHLWRRLLRAGVRLYEAAGPMMHAKAAVIDGAWSTVGSFNLDRRSILHNLEAAVVIVDRGFGARLEQVIQAELEAAHEVNLGEWLDRPMWRRALEWLCYRFRYWL